MPRFRILIQGESADPVADWSGFYATRDHEAESEASAKKLAIDTITSNWVMGGGLRHTRVIACWRPKPWYRPMTSGFSFYNDCAEGQAEALSIEAEAADAPGAVRVLKP